MASDRGVILSLDLGQRTGVALGRAGEKPRVSVVELKKPSEPRAAAFASMISYLQRILSAEPVSIIVIEAPLALQGFKRLGNAEATVRISHGLAAIVEAMAQRFGVEYREVHVATIRKHFLGVSGRGERKATKAAVVARCHALGYLPRTVRDDDMADAAAVFDYASAVFCRKPLPIALFEARAA